MEAWRLKLEEDRARRAKRDCVPVEEIQDYRRNLRASVLHTEGTIRGRGGPDKYPYGDGLRVAERRVHRDLGHMIGETETMFALNGNEVPEITMHYSSHINDLVDAELGRPSSPISTPVKVGGLLAVLAAAAGGGYLWWESTLHPGDMVDLHGKKIHGAHLSHKALPFAIEKHHNKLWQYRADGVWYELPSNAATSQQPAASAQPAALVPAPVMPQAPSTPSPMQAIQSAVQQFQGAGGASAPTAGGGGMSIPGLSDALGGSSGGSAGDVFGGMGGG